MEAGSVARFLFSFFLCASGPLVIAVQAAGLRPTSPGFRTQNFVVQADDPELARSVALAAEEYRRDLAVYWLGQPIPPWPAPCPIWVNAGNHLAAQGVTNYAIGPVRDFTMEVVGTPQRILDSVLPHEVTHTVLATYFGRPLPRWADEGICTTVEHDSERSKHEQKLREFLGTRRGIAMNRLFLLKEYPADVLPMYAQGYSVCQFLIAQAGPREFIAFLQDYMRRPSWTENVRKHYGYDSLAELQAYWLKWVKAGSGPVAAFVKKSPAALMQANPALRLASATEPDREHRPGVRHVADISTDSFYARRRDDPNRAPVGLASPEASRSLATRPSTPPGQNAVMPPLSDPPSLVPPSVRGSGRYSAAQPQPEQGGVQGMSRNGRPSGTGVPNTADLVAPGQGYGAESSLKSLDRPRSLPGTPKSKYLGWH